MPHPIPPDIPAIMDTTEDYSSLTVAILRERLSELGWSTRGLKKDLVERLKKQGNVIVKEEEKPVEEPPMEEPRNQHHQEPFAPGHHTEHTPSMLHPGVTTLPASPELTPTNPIKLLIQTLHNPDSEYHGELVTALHQVLSIHQEPGAGMNAPLSDASTAAVIAPTKKEVVAIDPKTGHILLPRFKKVQKDDRKSGGEMVIDEPATGSTGTFDPSSKDQIIVFADEHESNHSEVRKKNQNKSSTAVDMEPRTDTETETETSTPAAHVLTAPTQQQATRRSPRPRRKAAKAATVSNDVDICEPIELDFEKMRITASASAHGPIPITTRRRTRKKAAIVDVDGVVDMDEAPPEVVVVVKEEQKEEGEEPVARSRARARDQTTRFGGVKVEEEEAFAFGREMRSRGMSMRNK
ncbi:hypothetical protein YB2330_001745 [Saitoella coloradoensis]